MTEIQQMEAMNTLVDRFVRDRDLIDKKGWLLETMPRMYEIENPDLFDSVKSKLSPKLYLVKHNLAKA